MTRNHSVLVTCVCIIVLLVGGCAVTEQIQKNFEESLEDYPAPESLNANPQTTGILLIDALAEKSLNKLPLAGVGLAHSDSPENLILSGSFSTGGFFSPPSGVVLFQGLEPGTYRVIKIRTENVNMWETLFTPPTREFQISVSAGKPAYLGQIHVKHPMFTTDREFAINYDQVREAESWQKVIDKYTDSPWVDVIRMRIRELQ